jgi:hypothetical protein
MWFEGVENEVFLFRPSWAHHKQFKELPGFDTWKEAFEFARKICSTDGSNQSAISMFRPYVIEQPEMPYLVGSGAGSHIQLRVTRHAVNEDGFIEPKEAHAQEWSDAT